MSIETYDDITDQELDSHFNKLLDEANKQETTLNPWETTPRDLAIQNFHKRILNYTNNSSNTSSNASSSSPKDFTSFCQDPDNYLLVKDSLSINSSAPSSLVDRLREADRILKERREESLAVEMIRQSQYINSAKTLILDMNNLLVYLLSNLSNISNISELDQLINRIRNNKNKICEDFSYENKIKYIKDLNNILKLLKVQASIAVTFNQKLFRSLMEEFLPYLEDEEGKSNVEAEEPSVEFLYDVTASFVSFIQSLDAYKIKESL